MKRILSTILVLSSVCSFAQTLSFTKSNLDLGDVNEGELKNFHYVYQNLSNDTLTILDILPSCGCTSIEFEQKKVYPNQSGELHFVYDAKNKEGLDRKTITVIIEDTKPIVLVFEVNVIASRKK